MSLVRASYSLTIEFLEPVLGTAPKDRELYESYIIERAKKEGVEVDEEEELATIEDLAQRGWTGFHSDNTGLFLYDYQIRGYFKEAGSATKHIHGVKNVNTKVDRWLFVRPRRIYFTRNGTVIKQPESVLERPIRAMTMRGPRTSLVRSDSIQAGAQLICTLDVINDEISEKFLRTCLDYGSMSGMGQWRTGGYGRFTYDLELLEDLSKAEAKKARK